MVSKTKPVTLKDGAKLNVSPKETKITVTQLPEYVDKPSSYNKDLMTKNK